MRERLSNYTIFLHQDLVMTNGEWRLQLLCWCSAWFSSLRETRSEIYHNDERYTLPITLNSSGLWWKQHPAHVIFMRFAVILSSANNSLGPGRFAVLPRGEDEVRGFDQNVGQMMTTLCPAASVNMRIGDREFFANRSLNLARCHCLDGSNNLYMNRHNRACGLRGSPYNVS